MAVSEERREQNRKRAAEPRSIMRVERQNARKIARKDVLKAVTALLIAAPPGAYRDEVERLLSRI